MPSFDEIKVKQASLIRKGLDASVFVAPHSTEVPASLTDATGALVALPVGYTDLGWLSQDSGVNFARESEVSEVLALGSLTPVRRDVTSNNSTLTVVALEQNAKTLELYSGADLTNVEADAASGETQFTEATRPTTRYYRVLTIAVDGAPGEEIYFGRIFSRASVSEVGEYALAGEDPTQLEITFANAPDDDLGWAVKHFFAGPGWNALLEDAGFTRAVVTP